MVLLAIIITLGTSTVHAKVQKYRGHILSVNLAEKTMVLDHAKAGELTLKWDDRITIQGGTFEELKAWM